jgi:hypothetical protein
VSTTVSQVDGARRGAGSLLGVGSKGGKPRKPEQHHLPPVGSKANREYELRQKRKEAFGGWPIWLVGAILILGLLGWLLITL